MRPATQPHPPRHPLSRTGYAVRCVAAAVGLGLVIAGTVAGQDDDFPFGPFRMYSTRPDPNAPIVSTTVVGTTATGRNLPISGTETGLRRAEVEGQLARFERDPDLLGTLAVAYHRRNGGPPLTQVRIVVRRYALTGGKASGSHTDTVVARWTPSADGWPAA